MSLENNIHIYLKFRFPCRVSNYTILYLAKFKHKISGSDLLERLIHENVERNKKINNIQKRLDKIANNNEIEERIEERTNCSLRQTLVFKGIKEQKFEDKNYKGDLVTVFERWSDTSVILSEVIAKTCDTDVEDTRDWINIAHRRTSNPKKRRQEGYICELILLGSHLEDYQRLP